MSDLHQHAGFVILAVLLIAPVLYRPLKAERGRILLFVSLFALSLLGNAILLAAADPGSAAGQYLRDFCIFMEGLSLVCLLGVAVFRGLLPLVRVNLPRILQDVVVALVVVVWAFVLLRKNGVDFGSLFATSAVISAVLAFSLQDTLGNILGGMAIQFDQSIHVDDWIKIDDVVGRVAEINWRYTAIETRNWETVLVPNSQLMKNKFTVLARRAGQPKLWRRWVWFNVDFRYAPHRVIETVVEAIRNAEIQRVSREPQPNCVLMDFTDSYGRYALRYWLNDVAVDDPTDSEVRTHIYSALMRAGIQLSIPAHAVFVTQETEERKASKATRTIAQRIDAVRRIDLFNTLAPDEIQRLAEVLVPAPFASGDVITRQGAAAHWLYVIVAGHADVVLEGDEGKYKKVAELGPGQFFGEWGLMTGEPRQATVLARTDVECYRLDKQSFQKILQVRPSIAEEISKLLARRRTDLEAAKENLGAEQRASRLKNASTDILVRIRSLFGLEA